MRRTGHHQRALNPRHNARPRLLQERQGREQIVKKCGVDTKTWEKTLKLLRSVEELGLDYRMLKESILLPLENEVARVVVPHAFYRERLHRHEKIVQQAITKTSGAPIETVQLVAASEVLGEESSSGPDVL